MSLYFWKVGLYYSVMLINILEVISCLLRSWSNQVKCASESAENPTSQLNLRLRLPAKRLDTDMPVEENLRNGLPGL